MPDDREKKRAAYRATVRRAFPAIASFCGNLSDEAVDREIAKQEASEARFQRHLDSGEYP